MANDLVNRFFGGPPLSVLARLVLLSILVGVVLSAIGLDPWNIVHSVEKLIRDVLGNGLRRRAVDLALLPARRRAGGADLAAGAPGARDRRSRLNRAGALLQ